MAPIVGDMGRPPRAEALASVGTSLKGPPEAIRLLLRLRKALCSRCSCSFIAVVEDLAGFEVDDFGGEVSGVDEVQSQGLAGVWARELDEGFVVSERGVALLDGPLGAVAVVAAAGWPVAVAFLAVVLQAAPESFGEGG